MPLPITSAPDPAEFPNDFAESYADGSDRRLNQARLSLRIPQSLHQEPIISQLITKQGVTVNICAATLGESGQGDGWFTLELTGTNSQIRSALVYLKELDLEFWQAADAVEDW
jgi:ABC-type methionine transport system ATPase subunit